MGRQGAEMEQFIERNRKPGLGQAKAPAQIGELSWAKNITCYQFLNTIAELENMSGWVWL